MNLADRDKMGAPGYQEFKAEELRTAEMGGVRAVIIAGRKTPRPPPRGAPVELTHSTHSTHSSRRTRTRALSKPRVIVVVIDVPLRSGKPSEWRPTCAL